MAFDLLYIIIDSYSIVKIILYSIVRKDIRMPLYTKKIVSRASLIFLLVVFLFSSSSGQNSIEETIEQLSSDNVRGYIQPLLDGFGANINSGFPGSARIRSSGLTFRVQFVGMGMLVGDSEKTFFATPPQPFPQEPVETATIFGGEGTTVTHQSGIRYKFQNGQVDTRILPFAVPQLTVGDFFGTQLTLRYVPLPSISDFPEVNLFGLGVRHSVSQYLPVTPIDIAAGVFYQTFSIGEFMDSKAMALSLQASKTLLLLTLYGGVQYETADVNLSYTYTGPLPPGDTSDRNISLDLRGDNRFRVTAGAGLALGILHLHTDISFGAVTVVSAGLGFGI